MFDHVTIRVSDLEASLRIYRTLLERDPRGEKYLEWDDFGIAQADGDQPVTRNLHVAFAAESRHEVDDFWRRGVDTGYESDGEPGLRPQYHPNYYGGFLLDPDGNSVEACTGFRDDPRKPLVDHLWLGVRDLGASRGFWETVAPALSLDVTDDRQGRFHVWAGDRSFALVADGRAPSQNVHLAFPVADDEPVAEFHRVATAAGYRDNGGPGERPEYHPGYVGAFVLDPDGNNVEAVNRNPMRPRSANEWRDFWRDGGERELHAQLEEFAPYSVRIATLLGSNAPQRALVAELARIREHELQAPADPERDAELATRVHRWFERATRRPTQLG